MADGEGRRILKYLNNISINGVVFMLVFYLGKIFFYRAEVIYCLLIKSGGEGQQQRKI